jgi:hypothetical protein
MAKGSKCRIIKVAIIFGGSDTNRCVPFLIPPKNMPNQKPVMNYLG